MSKMGTLAVILASGLLTPALAYESSAHEKAMDVRDAQRALDGLGYPVGRTDGRLGPRTHTAIRNFQRDKGLNATGRLDGETVEALETASHRGEERRGEAADRGEQAQHETGAQTRTDADVRRAQQKLDSLGYPVSHVDGALGSETRTAIRNFQRDHGLNATGDLDDDTRAALEREAGSPRSGMRSR